MLGDEETMHHVSQRSSTGELATKNLVLLCKYPYQMKDGGIASSDPTPNKSSSHLHFISYQPIVSYVQSSNHLPNPIKNFSLNFIAF